MDGATRYSSGGIVSALAALCGAAIGFGLLLIFTKAAPRPVRDSRQRTLDLERLMMWIAAGVGGVAIAALTGWPVAAVAGGYGALRGLTSLRTNRRSLHETARIEALAGWAEQLRDTLTAGQGITETIRSTATVAPIEVRASVAGLARRIQHQRLDVALRDWADEMDDPTADLIASVLLLAATRSGRDVGRLLGTLADVARDRVAMRLRIDARRASTRTEARSLVGFSMAFFLLMIVFGGSFIDPYDTAAGQVVMAVVAVMVGVSIWWLGQLGKFRPTPRVLRPMVAVR